MLEARDLEKELERKQLSRKFSRILLISAAVLIGAVFSFPGNRQVVASMSSNSPDVANQPAPLERQPAAPSKAASQIPEEMKSFVAKPSDNSLKADLRFTMELLNFMQAPAKEPTRRAESVPAGSPQPITPNNKQ